MLNAPLFRYASTLVVVVWVTLGTIRCSSDTALEPAAEAVFQPQESTVVYRMTSSWAPGEGDQWLTSDLGFNVRLETLDISVAALELVPCETSTAATTLWDFIGPPRARAVHPELQDVSKIEPGFGVSLLAGEPVSLGEGQTGPDDYCAVHLLAYPTDDEALGGATLLVRGAWNHPDGRSGTFDGSMPLTYGRSLTLSQGLAPSPDGGPYVELELHPDRAFDGLELEGMTGSDLAWAVLKQLVETTTATYSQPAP